MFTTCGCPAAVCLLQLLSEKESAVSTSCIGCRSLELILRPRPDEPSNAICRHPNWGGYVNVGAPCCEGRRPDGSTHLMGYASKARSLAQHVIDELGIGFPSPCEDPDDAIATVEAVLEAHAPVRSTVHDPCKGPPGLKTCYALRPADPPNDCDWPLCGCDPAAHKVIAALEESGHMTKDTGLIVARLREVMRDQIQMGSLVNEPPSLATSHLVATIVQMFAILEDESEAEIRRRINAAAPHAPDGPAEGSKP